MRKKSCIVHLKRFFVLALSMLVLDILWISLVVGPVYDEAFNAMVRLRLAPAGAFYLLFNFGLYYFAFMKNTSASARLIRMDAAFFGLCVYGGYALTLLAVFSFYLVEIALLEIFWGALVSLLAAQSVLFFDACRSKKTI
jgi:uncharacterized membrane protein